MARNYLIIGGGTGIGRALIDELLSNGDNIYAASRNIKQANLPAAVNTITYDVLADDDITDLPDELHGMAYCPGSINLKPFKSYSIDKLRESVELNYLGAVKVLLPIINKLKKSKSGSVVFFSTVAVQMGLPYHSSVSASKGALEGLTRSLAAEYAPHVRFNAVAPSLTDTPLAENLLSNDKKRENNAERNPLKKIGTPEDVASMAAYLLGDKGAWITGQIMGVDGGMGSVRPL
jgi:NAD(P)-dependent dehydrogenase (short-subunit alcohol dehydrogenase family)